MKAVRGDRGFTLLELLVATALGALLLAALYAVFFSVLRGHGMVGADLERTREMRRFLDAFRMEVESSFFSKTNALTRFKGSRTDVEGESFSSLEFTAFVWPAVRGGAPTGDLRAIGYAVEGEDTKTLLKEVRDPYTQDERSSFKAPVMEDIHGFEISYFDGENWYDAWDAAEMGALPMAIKAAIILEEGKDARRIRAIVPVRMR